MEAKEATRQYRLAQWAEIIRARRGSTGNLAAFCEASGITVRKFYYWQRKLREAAGEQITAIAPGAGFAQVTVSETPAQLSPPETSDPARLNIEVGGVRMSADSTYPTSNLATLLRELSR